MSLTPEEQKEQDAEISRLKRIKLWLASGETDSARLTYWRGVVKGRRAEVDKVLETALAQICVTREHAAAITQTRKVIGDPVPDLSRRLALSSKAKSVRHLIPESVVNTIMNTLQNDVDQAAEDAYREMRRVPLKPVGEDPKTAAEVDAKIKEILTPKPE